MGFQGFWILQVLDIFGLAFRVLANCRALGFIAWEFRVWEWRVRDIGFGLLGFKAYRVYDFRVLAFLGLGISGFGDFRVFGIFRLSDVRP